MAIDGGSEGGEGDLGGSADLTGGGADTLDKGAPGGEGDKGGSADDGGGGDADWLASLSADAADAETPSNRDYVKAKGYKSLDDVVKAYRSAERTIHDKGVLKVPGDDAKPEEVAAFREAIGVPKDANGYEIKAPDGVALNEPLIGRLAEAAVTAGIPKTAFEATVAEFIKAQMDEAADAEAKQKTLAQDKIKEWGAKATENLAHIDKVARALGFTKTDMIGFRNALGSDRALDILAKLGGGMAEDILMGGGGNRFGVTPAEAKVEIDKLKLDPAFQAKVRVKGSPERARWDRLNAAIAEGKAAEE